MFNYQIIFEDGCNEIVRAPDEFIRRQKAKCVSKGRGFVVSLYHWPEKEVAARNYSTYMWAAAEERRERERILKTGGALFLITFSDCDFEFKAFDSVKERHEFAKKNSRGRLFHVYNLIDDGTWVFLHAEIRRVLKKSLIERGLW